MGPVKGIQFLIPAIRCMGHLLSGSSWFLVQNNVENYR